MQTTPENSRDWAQTACWLSDLAEEGANLERALEKATPERSECAAIAREIEGQWRAASRDEIEPFRGFNFWFPRRIAGYQVLRPLSQTVEETVCLARHMASGKILGLKLLAPGCGGSAEQLTEGIESTFEKGSEFGVPYLAFFFGIKPVIASTRELMQAARCVELPSVAQRVRTEIPIAKPTSASRPLANLRHERFFDWFIPTAQKIRGLWKRPAVQRGSFGFLAVFAGAALLVKPALPQKTSLAASGKPTCAMSDSARDKSAMLGSPIPDLEALDARLELDPLDEEALALRAVTLAQKKSPEAWRDFESLCRQTPEAFGSSALEDYLESQLGPKPRQIPSLKENRIAKASTLLDFAILGITQEANTTGLQNAAFRTR